jgi:predicted metal-dependent phosphoesterase TrpH
VLKVEFHSHSSDDPIDVIPYSTQDLIDRAAALGYDALAVTLHDRQLDIRPFESYAIQRRIVLIPGMERTIQGRHVLLLNFAHGADKVQSFDDLGQLKQQQPSGLVIAPHPFFPAGSALRGDARRHPELFDAVEYNAMFTSTLNFNEQAEAWARDHGKPMVGNGDVHRLEQMGTTYSLVDAPRNASAICEAVRAGDVKVVANPISWGFAARIIGSLYWSKYFERSQRSTQPVQVTA